MEYRRLGGSGLKLSALSYGSWVTFGSQVDVDGAVELMKTARERGVNFFDNAETYGDGASEIIMGKALKKLGFRRDSYCVSSKVFFGDDQREWPTQKGLSRKHVIEACARACQRLGVDYLDLYFCHRPDPETPIEETVRAMDTLIRQGRIMYWGTSEWSAQQITEAHSCARRLKLTPPTMEQPQYNLFVRDRVENEYAPLYDEIGLGTTVWSPLASGMLTGKYNARTPDNSRITLPHYGWLRESFENETGRRRLETVRRLTPLAAELGMSMAQLAPAWCLKNRNVSTVILGASKVSQLRENLEAVEMVGLLDEKVMSRIDEILGA